MLHCHAEGPILAYFRPPRRDPTLRDAVLMISIQWSVLILFIATDVAAAETSSTISPHFSPGGAIMAQDFSLQRVLATEERSGFYV